MTAAGRPSEHAAGWPELWERSRYGEAMQDRSLRERIVRYRADLTLPREQAAVRSSAYVYGNIIVFATTVPLAAAELRHGHGALLVLGVAAFTYLAHVFAEVIGHNVRSEQPLTRAELWHELRDSLPVLTSGMVPAALLLAGGLGWPVRCQKGRHCC